MRARSAAAALAVAFALAAAAPLEASELDEAIRAGEVGERWDGYVGAVSASPSPATQRLVSELNAKRREHYAQLAARNGVPVEEVGKLTGVKLIERAPAGSYVMPAPDGAWRRR
jgi:uncharacterized protein YdbL (DUF1318 family)